MNEAESGCDSGADLAESVFRYQFANNRSALKGNAAVYFLAVEDDADPGAELMLRFAGHTPPVRALSDLTMSPNAERVIDPVSGQPALIFRIYRRSELSQTESLVEGGYEEANLSASWITMRATCQQGAWRIERVGPEKIAGRRQ